MSTRKLEVEPWVKTELTRERVAGRAIPSHVCSRVGMRTLHRCLVNLSELGGTFVVEAVNIGCLEAIDMSWRGTSDPCCHLLAP